MDEIKNIEADDIKSEKETKEIFAKYQKYFAEKHGVKPEDIQINMVVPIPGTDDVNVEYKNLAENKFERIRRVTGYLVGTLDRWNDAKQAEERERVKHTIASCCE